MVVIKGNKGLNVCSAKLTLDEYQHGVQQMGAEHCISCKCSYKTNHVQFHYGSYV